MVAVSEGVELQLLLHVTLCHLPQHLLVLPQQQEDGCQLLLLHPGKSQTYTHMMARTFGMEGERLHLALMLNASSLPQ